MFSLQIRWWLSSPILEKQIRRQTGVAFELVRSCMALYWRLVVSLFSLFILPLDGMLVHRKINHNLWFASTIRGLKIWVRARDRVRERFSILVCRLHITTSQTHLIPWATLEEQQTWRARALETPLVWNSKTELVLVLSLCSHTGGPIYTLGYGKERH